MEKHTITIECSKSAIEELLPILKTLQKMGIMGCSRCIKIEEFGENFYFDGDGSSKIIDIKVDGKNVDDDKKILEEQVKYKNSIKDMLRM